MNDLIIQEMFPEKVLGVHHLYGDTLVAANYCGFNKPPTPIAWEWQHGHIIPERNIHPEFVIGSDGRSRQRKDANYLVARQDQVDYLQSHGYTNVVAVGLPIIYVKKPKVKRIPNSLLIMPKHTLAENDEFFNEEEYARYIDEISDKFSLIVCCIHKACFEKGFWGEVFNKRNIKVITGADIKDANSLNKMATLFSMFEYVTSNDFGSQIAYAAYFGAKPSVAGPCPKWEKHHYAGGNLYKNAPELLDVLDEWQNTNYMKTLFPFVFIEPYKATNQEKWASFQLGAVHKRNPSEFRKLVQWDYFTLSKNMLRRIYARVKYIYNKI